MTEPATCEHAEARGVGDRDLVFYDGHCGLCHRSIKWLMKHDPQGEHFVFAPLYGPTYEARVPAEKRAQLPDSVIVVTHDGEILTHSTAAFYLMGRVGGARGRLGQAGMWVPRPLRDLGYQTIAAVRHKLFERPVEACPMLPPEWRARFLP